MRIRHRGAAVLYYYFFAVELSDIGERLHEYVRLFYPEIHIFSHFYLPPRHAVKFYAFAGLLSFFLSAQRSHII